ncbi:hypothetical protein AAIR98_000742 [Elusimicrobium simillimum]|uniref:hypothetical protein n=1 Tax=Elusimicrobium simillimum TaxID=3143438 RepID=UPI003C6EAF13
MKKLILPVLFLLAAAACYAQSAYVIKAAHDIKKGETIANVNVEQMPQNDMQKGAFINTSKDAKKFIDIKYKALIDIPKNSQITKNIVTANDEADITVTPRQRGYALEVNAQMYELAAEGNFLSINVFYGGRIMELANSRVAGKKEAGGKYYLIAAVRPDQAQYLYFMEANHVPLHIVVLKTPILETSHAK